MAALRFHLSLAVQHRVESVSRLTTDIPMPTHGSRLGILFSGGLDSSVLAALADQHLPITEAIDLINVSFGQDKAAFEEAPDRQTVLCTDPQGLLALATLRRLSARPWNFIRVDVTPDQVLSALRQLEESLSHIFALVSPQNTMMDITIGTALWFAASAQGLSSARYIELDHKSTSAW